MSRDRLRFLDPQLVNALIRLDLISRESAQSGERELCAVLAADLMLQALIEAAQLEVGDLIVQELFDAILDRELNLTPAENALGPLAALQE